MSPFDLHQLHYPPRTSSSSAAATVSVSSLSASYSSLDNISDRYRETVGSSISIGDSLSIYSNLNNVSISSVVKSTYNSPTNMHDLLTNKLSNLNTNKQNYVHLEELNRNEIAILQYDSRPFADYWLSSALWNDYYCKLHGHTYIYYTVSNTSVHAKCRHGSDILASPWCKVKAMIDANNEYKHVKVFIYMDSDAVVDLIYKDIPLNSLLKLMQLKLNWNPNELPIVFNQDGPCWWCNMISEIGYKMCLNAGTVLWYRHENSIKVLNNWWDSSMDPYEGNPIKRPFRLKWPWEQDRQMALYHRSPEYIQIASNPLQKHMNKDAGHIDWCLSHLSTSGCFISHHCENKKSKNNLNNKYILNETKRNKNVIECRSLLL